MAVSEEFLADVLSDLAELGPVRSKRMFGGYGLYSADLFFGLCSQDVLYFRVDKEQRKLCLEDGLAFFDPRGDGKGLASYFEVPLELRKNRTKLKRWFDCALVEAAAKRPAKKKGLAALRNIGPKTRPWLAAVGVRSAEDLESRGVVDVWRAIRANEPTANMNLLYALEGARTGRLWSSLSVRERDSLKARVGSEG